jgi:glycosyltransferase involved in cell wall biosynthesis
MADAPIPIVVAAPPMRTGGTEQHLLHILPILAERGFSITAVLLAGGGRLEARLRESAVRVVSPPGDKGRPRRTFDQAMAIREAVLQTGASVLHAFLSEPYFAAWLANQLVGRRERPALVHGRRSLAFYGERQRLARFIERRLHSEATMLVGNSTAVATELMSECRSPEKVMVIHNGIPLPGPVTAAERAAARASFGIGDDELLFTMVANFHPYKGHEDLIEGLATADLQQPWRLLLPGRDGGSLSAVLARAEARGLTDRLILPGEMDGSRRCYAAADIGVLASHTEGFSNSLIEGMAAGLPMIATAVGGNLDAIIDGDTGLFVPVCAPDRIAIAAARLAASPALRQTLGEAARASAEARFSLDACVSAYERLWRSLAAGRGRP